MRRRPRRRRTVPLPPDRSALAARVAFEAPLWRGLAVYRAFAWLYALVVYVRVVDEVPHPGRGWLALALMAAWTLLAAIAYRTPLGRTWPFLSADLVVAVLSVVATLAVQSRPLQIEQGAQTLPVIWPAAAVLAWAVRAGPRAGAFAAVLVGASGLVVRGSAQETTLHNIVLLLLLGTILGQAVGLARRAEERLAVALQVQAATRERERLARAVHDGALQVLALVARQGQGAEGEPGRIAQLAAEQEAALRALISSRPPASDVDVTGARLSFAAAAATDLRSALASVSSPDVTLSVPGTEVLLEAHACRELAAAVLAALDNVRRHAAGAHAWVLVEDEPERVLVTVRDDGPGIPEGRLSEAAAGGRLGVAKSIRGRIADLGGTTTIVTAPGQGTEIEMSVPRRVIQG